MIARDFGFSAATKSACPPAKREISLEKSRLKLSQHDDVKVQNFLQSSFTLPESDRSIFARVFTLFFGLAIRFKVNFYNLK